MGTKASPKSPKDPPKRPKDLRIHPKGLPKSSKDLPKSSMRPPNPRIFIEFIVISSYSLSIFCLIV